ncbi:MAG TPA: type II secretion system protein N [Burkholderiaceae bacterium]|nr:type II secretion system protein N [Burkholderiaceae bacterium]
MRFRFPAADLATAALFVALCATTAYWAVTLLAPRAPIAPVAAVPDRFGPANVQLAATLFGSTAAPAAPTLVTTLANIQVLGVLSSGDSGVAILSVDGRPARAYQISERITDTASLVGVSRDKVRINRNGTVHELDAPPRPSIAVLSAGAAPQAPGSPARSAAAPLPPHGAAAAPRPGGLPVRRPPPGMVMPGQPQAPAGPVTSAPMAPSDAAAAAQSQPVQPGAVGAAPAAIGGFAGPAVGFNPPLPATN